ncbi:reductase [Aspergillus ustus]|uniref:Reductase n=1 Tax=Aspergillus ustus TaxID=40382 RepID=A0A0C1E755_ASPUT|nr:reductase [Aspergillus ustus]
MDVPGFALITGAASGIGRACALGFAREGAAGLALFDLNLDGLTSLKYEIETLLGEKASDCRIELHSVNIANEAQVTTTITEIAHTFGRLDYVVNAAGIAMKHPGGAAYVETSDWQRILDINLTGSFFVLRAAARIMLSQEPITSSIDGRALQRGSIVNFGSIQGVVGIAASTAYAVSKHGIVGLTRTASEDYAKEGIRVNAICPGYTLTPLTSQPEVLKVMEEKVASCVPMGRMGTASEIADGVLYLAGGRSSFVTGTTLMVDGGYTQR